jgi:hypothetical protein
MRTIELERGLALSHRADLETATGVEHDIRKRRLPGHEYSADFAIERKRIPGEPAYFDALVYQIEVVRPGVFVGEEPIGIALGLERKRRAPAHRHESEPSRLEAANHDRSSWS